MGELEDARKVLEDFVIWAEGKPTEEAQQRLLELRHADKGVYRLLLSEYGLNVYDYDEHLLSIFDWHDMFIGPDAAMALGVVRREAELVREMAEYEEVELIRFREEQSAGPHNVCEDCGGAGVMQNNGGMPLMFALECTHCGGTGTL